MSLLFNVVFASVCRNTHHRLALDALRHLRGIEAERWTDLFLHHYQGYLTGSKAPDDQFHDFQNHVLHVTQNGWGGAIGAARRWYGRTVDALRRQSWAEAVHAAGVFSHYFSDPFMPLHTDQTETEAKVHRALEWSVAKSYGELQHIIDIDLGGYPRVEIPKRDDWLAQMITQGAELAHSHYHAVIDHYDLAKGVKNPPTGMDQECKDRIAKCLGHCVVGLARALERAFEESEAEPPHVELTLQGFVATLAVPIRYVLNQIHDLHERLVVEAIYDEIQRTGKVLQNLPEDDRTVRQLHADEVLKVPLKELDAQPAEATGTKHGQGQADRHLPNQLITSPVIDTGSGADSLLRPKGAGGVRSQETGGSRQDRYRFRGSGVGSRPLTRRASEESAPSPQEPKRDPVPKRFDVQPPPVPLVSAPLVSTPKAPAAEVKPTAPSAEAKAELPPKAAASIAAPTAVANPKSQIPNPKSDSPATLPLRFRLEPRHPVVDAPSIGSKTAGRLEKAGIMTVAELLAADPDKLAGKLNVKHITPQTIRTWQAESTLCCRVPELYGHDAQILVASGVTDPAEAASLTPEELLELVTPFVKSVDGQRLLRGSSPPDLAEVTNWIAWSRQSRVLPIAA